MARLRVPVEAGGSVGGAPASCSPTCRGSTGRCGSRRSSELAIANPWFVSLLERLLEAEPDVLDLLARDPFDGRPLAAAVRAVVWDYRFTDVVDAARRRETWWKREALGLYCPVLERPAPRAGD